MTDRTTLTLGPLLFNWDADRWVDFYFRIADEAPVERVIVGEVVCSKRLPFYADRIPGVVERLQKAGKTVVLPSLALVSLKREREMCAEMAEVDGVEIEVNDLTVLCHLEPGRSFSVGPMVNVYNEGTVAFLSGRGATQICLPPELPIASVEILAAAAQLHGTRVEVWAFGRLPLAVSGRCYHARAHGLAKDNCQFVCEADPDGLIVETLDGQDFLAINGIQTLSFTHANLIRDLDRLRAADVGALRLSPHSCDMVAVARQFRDVLDGRTDGDAAAEALAADLPEASFSNGFLFGDCGAEYRPAP